MKRLRLLMMILCLTQVLHATPEYILGAGDALSINVITRPKLSTTQTIAPDGSIHLPLLGRWVIDGQTLAHFQSELKQKYEPFLKSPVLSIQLTPKPIYIVQRDLKTGLMEVKTAGSIEEAWAYLGKTGEPGTLKHGQTYGVDLGKKPGFFEKNWYKVLTAVAIVVGVTR